MSEVVFLPPYAEVLAQVLATAQRQGTVDVAVRPDLDAAVVAGQVRFFAAKHGVAVRCSPEGDRVTVRAGTKGRVGRAS